MSWKHEPRRHSLAARGIKTKHYVKTPIPTLKYKNIVDPTSKIINVYDNDRKIGQISILTYEHDNTSGFTPINEKHLTIGNVYVDDPYQGQGIGGKLIRDAIQLQQELNIPLYLVAEPPAKWQYEDYNQLNDWNKQRDELIELYKHHGFEIDEIANDHVRMVRRNK